MASLAGARASNAGHGLAWYQRKPSLLLISVLSLGLGLWLGRRAEQRSRDTAHVNSPAPQPPAITSVRVESPSHAVAVVRSVPAACDEEDGERAAAFHEQQSREVVELLDRRMRIVSAAFGDQNPEMVAQHMRLYTAGMADGILRATPQLTERLAKHVETALCDPKAKDAQLMVMARLAGDAPELASAAGFDCLFSARKEDLVLWTALDAWRSSGLPRSEALESVARSASDMRTKVRLHPELIAEQRQDPTAIALREDPDELNPGVPPRSP